MPQPVIEAMLLTLSVPIKPGAIHRLAPTPEYEARLLEAVAIAPYLELAAERGRELARGSRDARGLGLGRIVADALRRAFERTGLRPLTGIAAMLVPLSAAYGYHEILSDRVSVEEAVRRIVKSLYVTPGEDTASLVEGLEGVGDRDLVLHLDRQGLTRRRITVNDVSLGDLYEELARLDTGFFLTLRLYTRITGLAGRIRQAPNTLAGILAAYLDLLAEKIPDARLGQPSMKALRRLDERLSGGPERPYNRLLGAIAGATAIALLEEPPSLPEPS